MSQSTIVYNQELRTLLLSPIEEIQRILAHEQTGAYEDRFKITGREYTSTQEHTDTQQKILYFYVNTEIKRQEQSGTIVPSPFFVPTPGYKINQTYSVNSQLHPHITFYTVFTEDYTFEVRAIGVTQNISVEDIPIELTTTNRYCCCFC
jgi:hypothetical protein